MTPETKKKPEKKQSLPNETALQHDVTAPNVKKDSDQACDDEKYTKQSNKVAEDKINPDENDRVNLNSIKNISGESFKDVDSKCGSSQTGSLESFSVTASEIENKICNQNDNIATEKEEETDKNLPKNSTCGAPFKNVSIKIPSGKILQHPVCEEEQTAFFLQTILDNNSALTLTCTELHVDGRKLKETDIVPLDSTSYEIKVKKYTERDVRFHLQRLQNLLNGIDAENSEFHVFPGHETLFFHLPENISSGKNIELEEMVESWKPRFDVPPAIKSVSVSGWNPPPPARMFKGDVSYLSVTTVEGKAFEITCSSDGFYVNQSDLTEFNPEIVHGSKVHQTVDALLSDISPCFNTAFEKVVEIHKYITDSSSCFKESVPVSHIPRTWIVPAALVRHKFDAFRSFSSYSGVHTVLDTSIVDSPRDWNDEIQTMRSHYIQSKDVPIETSQSSENSATSTCNASASEDEKLSSDESTKSSDSGAKLELMPQLHPYQAFRQYSYFHGMFLRAALAGVRNVLNGSIAPLSVPSSDDEEKLYLWNQIFFVFSEANKGRFKNLCDDPRIPARSMALKELRSQSIIEALSCKDLHTMTSTVIDYCGHRISAQTVVPGLFSQNPAPRVSYGASDSFFDPDLLYQTEKNERVIYWKPEIHEKLSQIAEKLFWKEHEVFADANETNVDSKKVKLYPSAELRALVANDGRTYVFDVYRLTPIDKRFYDLCREDEVEAPYPIPLCMVRHELLISYAEARENLLLENQKNDYASKNKSKTAGCKNQEKGSLSASLEMNQEDVNSSLKSDIYSKSSKVNNALLNGSEVSSKDEELEESSENCNTATEISSEIIKPLTFNMDTYFDEIPKTYTKEDKEEVEKLYDYLYHYSLPSYIEMLFSHEKMPSNGLALSSTLHSYGLSIRHLGAIYRNVVKVAERGISVQRIRGLDVTRLLRREMLVRAFKHVAGHYISTNMDQIPAVVSKLLNLLMESIDFPSAKFKGKGHVSLQTEVKNLRAKDFINMLLYDIARRYRCVLKDFAKESKRLVLRLACISLGIQLRARLYAPHFHVAEDDVVGMLPRVHSADLRFSEAHDMLTSSVEMFNNQEISEGLSLLETGWALCEAAYGPLHHDSLSMLHYVVDIYTRVYANEPTESIFKIALDHATTYVVLCERLYGIDDYEVARAHLFISRLYGTAGHYEQAVKHIDHGMRIMALNYEETHPDFFGFLEQRAKFCSKLGRHADAVRTLESLFERFSTLPGTSSEFIAETLENLSHEQEMIGDSNSAFQSMRKAYNMYEAIFGKNSKHVQQCASKMTELSRAAVAAQKIKSKNISCDKASDLKHREIVNLLHSEDLKSASKKKSKKQKPSKSTSSPTSPTSSPSFSPSTLVSDSNHSKKNSSAKQTNPPLISVKPQSVLSCLDSEKFPKAGLTHSDSEKKAAANVNAIDDPKKESLAASALESKDSVFSLLVDVPSFSHLCEDEIRPGKWNTYVNRRHKRKTERI